METYLVPEFEFESGATIQQAPVRYKTWGELNDRGDNAIIVCHALTGNPLLDEWWGGLLGPGKALDTAQYFVVAANVLASPYGSVSPLSINPATNKPYGGDFPEATIRDTVALHKHLLDALGVSQLAMAIGGSMGGMQVLEWGFYGDYVRALVPVAVGGRHSAWCIAWGEAQRQAIYADANWQGGYYEAGAEPHAGLAAARMMAMVSYRSMPSLKTRFGRVRMEKKSARDEENTAEEKTEMFSIESYLQYQGDKLVERFDANCYVHLTKQMDSHDVSRGRGAYPEVLSRLHQPTLVVGIESDVLYSLPEQEELVEFIPNARLELLPSIHGHDAFLIELTALNDIVLDWMKDSVISESRKPTIAVCSQ
ncbi:MAG: homoserine O-acetyltransferase [Rhodothermales bacterium]